MNRSLIAAALVVTTACSTAHLVPLAELRALDGYDAAREGGEAGGRKLRDQAGEPIVFNSGTPLKLTDAGGGVRTGEVLKLRLDETELSGLLTDGSQMKLKLDGLQSAEVRTFSPAKTAVLTVALILGAVLAYPLIWGLGCAANPHCE